MSVNLERVGGTEGRALSVRFGLVVREGSGRTAAQMEAFAIAPSDETG